MTENKQYFDYEITPEGKIRHVKAKDFMNYKALL